MRSLSIPTLLVIPLGAFCMPKFPTLLTHPHGKHWTNKTSQVSKLLLLCTVENGIPQEYIRSPGSVVSKQSNHSPLKSNNSGDPSRFSIFLNFLITPPQVILIAADGNRIFRSICVNRLVKTSDGSYSFNSAIPPTLVISPRV